MCATVEKIGEWGAQGGRVSLTLVVSRVGGPFSALTGDGYMDEEGETCLQHVPLPLLLLIIFNFENLVYLGEMGISILRIFLLFIQKIRCILKVILF